MSAYEIRYAQTAHERYETQANTDARKAVEALGIAVTGEWGGCALGMPDHELAADQGFSIEVATDEQLASIEGALNGVIGHLETLVIELV